MRYEVSFNRFNRVFMALLLIGPRNCVVELDERVLRLRFGIGGYGFRGDVPRDAIVASRPYNGFVGGWGAHGWAGRWLLNGSSKGIVELDIAPIQRARVLGVPVKVRRLRISLVDRDGFLAAVDVRPVAPADASAEDRTAAT